MGEHVPSSVHFAGTNHAHMTRVTHDAAIVPCTAALTALFTISVVLWQLCVFLCRVSNAGLDLCHVQYFYLFVFRWCFLFDRHTPPTTHVGMRNVALKSSSNTFHRSQLHVKWDRATFDVIACNLPQTAFDDMYRVRSNLFRVQQNWRDFQFHLTQRKIRPKTRTTEILNGGGHWNFIPLKFVRNADGVRNQFSRTNMSINWASNQNYSHVN